MPINTLQYAAVFNTALDELLVHDALTNWTEDNARNVRYNGGKEIKIPKRTLAGLADYDRDNGYPLGAVSVSWETVAMSQDRSRKFRLDAMDVDETNFVAEASAVLAQFQREYVVPEVDAYRITKMYEAALAANQVTTGQNMTGEEILAAIKQDIAKVQNNGADRCVIHISYAAKAALETSTAKLTLSNITWSTNGIDTQVSAIDNNPLIATPDNRMYTSVTIDEANGYTGTGHINWLVIGIKAPIGISKTEVSRIFAPDVNQQADAWDVTYRKYHDIFVPDNKKQLIVANVAPPTNATVTFPVDKDKYNLIRTRNGISTRITTSPFEIIAGDVVRVTPLESGKNVDNVTSTPADVFGPNPDNDSEMMYVVPETPVDIEITEIEIGG